MPVYVGVSYFTQPKSFVSMQEVCMHDVTLTNVPAIVIAFYIYIFIDSPFISIDVFAKKKTNTIEQRYHN